MSKGVPVRPPEELYSIHRNPGAANRPVLVHAFTGFVDAGAGVRVAAEHILKACEHQLIASFDVDEVLDYRARRPRMSFVMDHFASVDIPQITLHEVTDSAGTPFLLLVGPEPDYQWQRFIQAVDRLARQFEVRLAVGLSAIPWPAPHTRPMGLTMHGSEPDLIAGHASVIGEIEVPGHIEAMLEFHLGQHGIPSVGVTAQVPHYLVQYEYPQAAQALLGGLTMACGLLIPSQDLADAGARASTEIEEQLAANEEFRGVVAALESQYDQGAAVGGAMRTSSDLAASGQMPTGEEIAAQVEQFLQGLSEDDDRPKDGD
jgi:hypothetical protein